MDKEEDWETILEDMFKRIAKARNEVRGMRLSYQEIRCLELTFIGELIDEYEDKPNLEDNG